MSSREDRDLQRYHDGEIGLGRAKRVRRRLETEQADRLRLDALEQMRELLVANGEAAADEADFSALWGRVAQGISESRVSPARGPVRRLFGWIALGVSATAAVAIALMVWLAVPPRSNECVIESLEVGPSAVSTIFTIADPELAGDTTVIWISDRAVEGRLE